jgi:hypothetical protein
MESNVVNYTAHHACKADGGFKHISENAPFLSLVEGQWLTQGYYFWVDGQSHAIHWGKSRIRQEYAVIEARLCFEGDELLNLVSSGRHSYFFDECLKKFKDYKNSIGDQSDVTVSDCIAYYREKAKLNVDMFPFKAIMAAERNDKESSIKFVSTEANALAFNPRVQLCLFEGAEEVIAEKRVIHPKAWVA